MKEQEGYYYCKCCGYDFSEEEGKERYNQDPYSYDEITCPMCEAFYNEEEYYIERYSK